jgi:UDP-2,3-diacylglucosamine pyrophosphatase LpxH
MAEQVFVISDLHLGGEPGFQMCSPAGQKLLAGFTRWVTSQQQPGRDAHIVIAGDGVDFLAENPSSAFTGDEGEAARKLGAIFEHTREVWDALRAHVAAGAKLTVMLGNHDIELSLPRVRRMFGERLGVGRVEILYDDEAVRIGGLVIEHGNRYDDWNWVDHDQLRRVRRNLSRGEKADFFKAQPGSLFVINVMNEIKRDYPFVDLLKPEEESVAPFMALLRPDLTKTIKDAAGVAREWIGMKLHAEGIRNDSNRAVGSTADDALQARTGPIDDTLRFLDELAGTAPAESTRFVNLFGAKERDPREVYLTKLREVLRRRLGDGGVGFDVNVESPTYLEPAEHAARNGAKVVVYGHTHLVKRIALSGGATYLNSGTWADLMRVPVAALREETPEAEALRLLGEFADDLTDRARVERWRKQVPTFARVDIADDLSIRRADVHLYREGAPLEQMSIPDGPLEF